VLSLQYTIGMHNHLIISMYMINHKMNGFNILKENEKYIMYRGDSSSTGDYGEA